MSTPASSGVGRGFGKVILIGEHAVVYGEPALAAAIDRQVVARATPILRGHPARLVVPAWGVDLAVADDAAPARALRAVGSALGIDAAAYDLRAEADVPPRAGLGSSAAFAVAAARALLSAAGGEADDAAVERAAGAAEQVFHGRASGVDVALASRGGMGLFTRAGGLTPLAPFEPFELVVGLSGEPRDTGARVADVAVLRERRPALVAGAFGALGALARAAADFIVEGRLEPLGEAFSEAEQHLVRLGLETPRLHAMIAAAGRAGALGAKLTGAGGGGAMIALPAPGQAAALAAALGTPAQVVTLAGAPP